MTDRTDRLGQPLPEASDEDTRGMIDLTKRSDSLSLTIRSVFQYRELLRSLVLKDLKLKYRGSVLGFLWSIMNPLVMTVVYTVAFTYILRIRTEAFVFYLLLGLLAWTFFSNSASMAAGSIAESGGVMKSVFFPRAILPIATVLFNLVQYLLTAAVFLPVMLVYHHVAPAAPMLLFPVFLALQVVFTVGVALMGAVLTHQVGVQSRSTSDPRLIELASRPDAIVQETTRASISPDALEWLRNALADGLHSAFLVGIGIAIVAFFVSLWFPPGSARELAEKREHPDP